MAASGERPDDDRSDPAPVVVAEYSTYSRAQAALDRLLGQGLPHASVSLVWSRLRQIEPGRPARPDPSAVLEGALAGATIGGSAGILVSLSAQLQDGMSAVAVVAWWTIAFAVVGAVGRAVAPLRRRDQRLPAGGELAAESYQLWVDDDVAPRAAAILGVESEPPPPDPAPSGQPPTATTTDPSMADPAVHASATTLLGPDATGGSERPTGDPRPPTT
jgi:hypothetical protein